VHIEETADSFDAQQSCVAVSTTGMLDKKITGLLVLSERRNRDANWQHHTK
jgi:hypothetical protein